MWITALFMLGAVAIGGCIYFALKLPFDDEAKAKPTHRNPENSDQFRR